MRFTTSISRGEDVPRIQGFGEPSPLIQVRESLLERVCNYLNRAARRQPEKLNAVVLLRLLVEDEPAGLTGFEIEERLRKENGWGKRQIKRLRDDLDGFRKGAGATLAWRFEIDTLANGCYVAVLRINTPRQGPEAVWLPHLWRNYEGGGGRKNWLVLTEPSGFRDPSGSLHVLHSSVWHSDPELLFGRMKGLRTDVSVLMPSALYVSFGDVVALRTIENGLNEIKAGSVVGFTTNQDKRWNELCAENFILVGSWWANEMIKEFQETERRLVITAGASGVSVRGAISEKEQRAFYPDGAEALRRKGSELAWELSDRPGKTYFAIFTRISDPVSRQAKSVITSNHGAASEAVARYLFSREVEDSLIPAIVGDEEWTGLPGNYQLLFKVSLAVGTERRGKAELVTFRVLEEVASA